jgi:hypothetical protein
MMMEALSVCDVWRNRPPFMAEKVMAAHLAGPGKGENKTKSDFPVLVPRQILRASAFRVFQIVFLLNFKILSELRTGYAHSPSSGQNLKLKTKL